MRLMKLERELDYVRSDRDRNEIYLTRILKEVDQKVSSSLSSYPFERDIFTCFPLQGGRCLYMVVVWGYEVKESLVWKMTLMPRVVVASRSSVSRRLL